MSLKIPTYVITMMGVPLSEAIAQDTLESLGKFGEQGQKFPATHGKDIETHWTEHELKQFKIGQKFKTLNPGLVGCLLSHLRLWKLCREQNEPFLILEHDAVQLRDIPEYFLSRFDDVLHLDRYSRLVEDYNSHCLSNRGEGIHNHCDSIPNLSGTELLNKTSIKGSHSYIITPTGANKMIDYVWAKGALSPDVALNSTAVNLKYTDTSYFRINEKYWINRKRRSSNSFCRPKKYKQDQLKYY